VSYRQLLDVFFDRVDPTTLNRQGNDRGTQYRSAIYTHDGEQLQQAQQKIAEVNEQLAQVRPAHSVSVETCDGVHTDLAGTHRIPTRCWLLLALSCELQQ
jgi:peptide methionine sulfoxide reductase MsrA